MLQELLQLYSELEEVYNNQDEDVQHLSDFNDRFRNAPNMEEFQDVAKVNGWSNCNVVLRQILLFFKHVSHNKSN